MPFDVYSQAGADAKFLTEVDGGDLDAAPLPITLRRGTTAERDASNPILAAGEPAVVLDSGQPAELVLGDGVTAMADLRAAVWDDDARLAAAATAAQPQPTVPRVPAAAVAIQSPYDLAGTGVHPAVVDAGAGKWNGWRYWMAYTPYWRSVARYENPCILVSNDGQNWVVPAGLTNPIDPDPAGDPINSDPDLLLVGGTLYCYYRQHDPVSGAEQIMLRTSTDGVTWSAEVTTLDTPGNRLQTISPSIIHDGTQFVLYYTKDAIVKRRTSADGVMWSAEGATTGITVLATHVAAIRGTDGRVHLLLQEIGPEATTQWAEGARTIRVAKSANGTAFTVGTIPLLTSEHMAQRMIYRTCGLVEDRNGHDYYKLWASCVSLGVASTAAEVLAEEAEPGPESYYIGYTEGYDPNDTDPSDRESLYPAGSVIAGGDVRGQRVGGLSIWGRFIVGVRGYFDRLRVQEFRAAIGVFEGQSQGMVAATPEWASKYGYTSAQRTPSLVIGSPFDVTDGEAIIGLINTSPGYARPIGSGWHIAVNKFGHLGFYQRAETGVLTLRGYFDCGSGDLVMNRNVTTSVNVNCSVLSASGKVSTTGNSLGIGTISTPSGTADAAGTVGEIRRDDSYLYVKTAAGWKRAALSTW